MRLLSFLKSVRGKVLGGIIVLSLIAPTPVNALKNTQGEGQRSNPNHLVDHMKIDYQGEMVTLSEHALYVNGDFETESAFAFKTLQAAVGAAQPGTKEMPTVIYLEPDVYWTDDYSNPAVRDKDDLIGLLIPQSYITLLGMTGNPEDVVIASDRGQNAGANGNFNTLGIAQGFHAKDITIGNYCNIDLIYTRNPSKNHAKRQEAITQAQVITKVPNEKNIDEWFFQNCHIVSRLNVFSRDERPFRTLLDGCYIECDDDSLGTGYITIFKDCDINLYSTTPCGGASFYMQAYLGCDFTTELKDKKIVTLCKNTAPFAFIDCTFGGDMTGMEWKQNNLVDELRQIVSNNTLNGAPFVISPGREELSVTPDDILLEAFKYKEEYNVYNLLNNAGHEEWDPLGQKDSMPISTWNLQFDYKGMVKDVVPSIEGNASDSLEVSVMILGGKDETVTYSTADNILDIETLENGHVLVKGINESVVNKTGCLVATASNGMSKVLYITVTPKISEASLFTSAPTLLSPQDGEVTVLYELSENEKMSVDRSMIQWYRGTNQDGSDKAIVAQTTYVTSESAPHTSYTLGKADIGKYLFAEVRPQRAFEKAGESKMTGASVLITDVMVPDHRKGQMTIDLEHLAYITGTNDTKQNNFEWLNEFKSGYWYGGFYLPMEYREGNEWSDKIFAPQNEHAYLYAEGASGAAGIYGLQTRTQGAKLVYVDDSRVNDMKLSINLSPHKTAGQGFGSAKQYLDIFIKYDLETLTGYGLRIARVAEISDPQLASYAASSCTFTLMEYQNGMATALSQDVVSSVFLPDLSIELEIKDNVFTADLTTTTVRDSNYSEAMSKEVHLKHNFATEVNTFSGYGFQHTGTAGEGKSGNRTTIESIQVAYGEESQDSEEDKDEGATKEKVDKVIYTVKAGDYLSKIAKDIYGNAHEWRKIYEMNKDQIKDPNLIYVGQKLKL